MIEAAAIFSASAVSATGIPVSTRRAIAWTGNPEICSAALF